MPHSRPYLDTVVLLEAFDGNGEKRWAGTGFFCRARHWHQEGREFLFLVTNAHVVKPDMEGIVVLFAPRQGDGVAPHTFTARIGRGAWRVRGRHDLAVLQIPPTQLQADAIRYRSFELETETLTLRELRKHRIATGNEALLVGFALPHRQGPRQYPAVRRASIRHIPSRAGFDRTVRLEGTALPGNSGSPLVLKPGPNADADPNGGAGGKLVGILCRAGRFPASVRSDDQGRPTEIREGVDVLCAVPVDALRDLIAAEIASIIFAETFGPMVRRVKGWFRRRGRADQNRVVTRAVRSR